MFCDIISALYLGVGARNQRGVQKLQTFLDSGAVLDAGGFGGELGGVPVRVFAHVDGHHYVLHPRCIIYEVEKREENFITSPILQKHLFYV